jgi:hypothetical protein
LSPATTAMLNNILNYNFGSQAYSPALPATMYFGLSTTLVGAAGLATVTEPLTASAYARVAYVNDTAKWTTSSTGSLSNKVVIAFPQSSASWGTILSVFIADSATRAAGNVLWYTTLAPSILIQNYTIYSIAIGAIVVTMT